MIFTFSTKTKKPQDTELIEAVKKRCDDTGANFSAYVIAAIKEVERGREVSDSK